MATKHELSQSQLIDYLKDTSDIEVREFTLRKATEELTHQKAHRYYYKEKKATEEKNSAEASLNRSKTELLRQRPYSDAIFNTPPKEPVKPENWDKLQTIKPPEHYGQSDPFGNDIISTFDLVFSSFFIWGGIYLALSIIGIVSGLLFSAILSSDFGNFMSTSLPILAIISAVITFLIAKSRRKRSIKKYQKKTETWKAACDEYQIAYEPIQAFNRELSLYQQDCENYNAYQRALKKYQEKEAVLVAIQKEKQAFNQLVDQQIAALQPHIDTLFNQKYQLYNLNIIPPDYRKLDCVLMLLQIFRNGLKNNMADAILLYEERVFRQEVITGLDKIYNMLGCLNSSMRAIEERLIDVKQEVQMIGSDLCGRLDQMAAQAKEAAQSHESWMEAQERWQEDMLSQSRASCYAAEAVQNSNYKYEWYMEQHRQGLL